MKKILVVVFCLLVCAALYADVFYTTAVGLSMMKFTEVASSGDAYVRGIEKSTAMNIDLRSSSFKDNALLGFNFGLSAIFPISSRFETASGPAEVSTEFFDCQWCPQVGFAIMHPILENLTMVGNAGYELMMHFSSSEDSDGARTRRTLLVHGFYGTDTFILDAGGLTLSFGVSVFIPIFGTYRVSSPGYSSRSSCAYSGMSIEPFVGIAVSR